MSDQTGGYTEDNDYAKTKGDDPIPVVKDSETVESGVTNPTEFEGGENSDEQLQKDDADAIDESNIIQDGSSRSAKPTGSMAEPGDEEGLPTDDGTSSGA